MEITPARLTQVQATKRNCLVAVTDDVGGVAQDLHDIDRRLRLRYDPDQAYFVVYYLEPDGRERLVTTATELDQRLVNRIREISSDGYDFAKAVERADAQAKRDREHGFAEARGPYVERLAWALRKDLGVQSKSLRKNTKRHRPR